MGTLARRPRAVIYYVGFGLSFGGAEYCPLIVIRELLRFFDVTLAMDWVKYDPRDAMRAYGIDFDSSSLRIVSLKPEGDFRRRIDSVIPIFTVHRLQKIARGCDVCVSCANMVDFGKPGFHFIYLLTRFGDNAFNDFYLHRPALTGWALVKRHFRTFVAERFLRPLLGVRSARSLLADQKERIYATSDYVLRTMRAFYGPFNNRTVYPPTIFEFDGPPVPRDPLKVVYIGRITALKGVREILMIVERARRDSGIDFKLELAGAITLDAHSPYVQEMERLVAERPWAKLAGDLYGEDKRRFLLGGTFAIHACRCEAFGISIVEYLKAGVVPLVPDEGGSPEVVDERELTFANDEAAARILVRLASDESFRSRMQEHCRRRAARFSRDSFAEEVRDLIETEFIPSMRK